MRKRVQVGSTAYLVIDHSHADRQPVVFKKVRSKWSSGAVSSSEACAARAEFEAVAAR